MPVKSTFPQSAANFPNATTAPGFTSTWQGPKDKPVSQPAWKPASRAKR